VCFAMLPRPLPAALLAVAAALAGCTGGPAAPGDVAGPGSDDHPSGHAVTEEGHPLEAAPAWQVGQWWDHRWYFTPADTAGFTVKSIVVGNGSDGHRLATDEAIDAASHAAFYFHDLGTMGPDWILRDDGGAFQFPWYSFPLHDGKAWTAREENIGFDLQPLSQDLTLRATAINGTPGAFAIEARTSDGSLRALYDYQPAIGWFSEYRAYGPGTTDPEQWTMRMVDEAHGRMWSGTYYTATGDLLLGTVSVLAPMPPTAPSPPRSFMVAEAHTHVVAVAFAFAAAGASAAELVAPDGRHWEAAQVSDHEGNPLHNAQQDLLFVPSAAGEWRFATAGAGAFVAGGGCFAWGVTMSQATL
jgi:hypothetical protein